MGIDELRSDSNVRGFVAGLLVALVGYAVALWQARPVYDVPDVPTGTRYEYRPEFEYWAPVTDHAPLLYFDFHDVPVDLLTGATETNALFLAGGPYLLLAALPPVCLLAAGLWTSRGSLQRGAVTGAKVALGYVTAAVALTVASALFSLSFHPSPSFLSVFVAGGLYPLVFGGIGGVVAAELAYRRHDDSDAPPGQSGTRRWPGTTSTDHRETGQGSGESPDDRDRSVETEDESV